MYEYLFIKMDGCMCIDISSGFLADEKHVWGLSLIHFQEESYERVLEEIDFSNKLLHLPVICRKT